MSKAEKLSTGQAIARSLIRNGIDTIFGIPGAHTYDFIDALHECRDKIRFIVNRHEQGSGYMAYGYAKSTGRVGAFTCEFLPLVLVLILQLRHHRRIGKSRGIAQNTPFGDIAQ